MPHTFFTVPGFLTSAPFREEFMLVDAAAHECSLLTQCRGFTLSLTYMADDALHFVRFFDHANVAVNGDWLTHLKEPAQAYRYIFSPGYLVPRSPSSSAAEVPAWEQMHQLHTTLGDALSYCDAEPSCEGFMLPRDATAAPDQAGAQGGGGDGQDDGLVAVDAQGLSAVERAWITFVGRRDGSVAAVGASGGGGGPSRPGVTGVFDHAHVSYLKTSQYLELRSEAATAPGGDGAWQAGSATSLVLGGVGSHVHRVCTVCSMCSMCSVCSVCIVCASHVQRVHVHHVHVHHVRIVCSVCASCAACASCVHRVHVHHVHIVCSVCMCITCACASCVHVHHVYVCTVCTVCSVCSVCIVCSVHVTASLVFGDGCLTDEPTPPYVRLYIGTPPMYAYMGTPPIYVSSPEGHPRPHPLPQQ